MGSYGAISPFGVPKGPLAPTILKDPEGTVGCGVLRGRITFGVPQGWGQWLTVPPAFPKGTKRDTGTPPKLGGTTSPPPPPLGTQ